MLTEISVENVALIEEATLELTPGLSNDGVVCPTHPAWEEFLEARCRVVTDSNLARKKYQV